MTFINSENSGNFFTFLPNIHSIKCQHLMRGINCLTHVNKRISKTDILYRPDSESMETVNKMHISSLTFTVKLYYSWKCFHTLYAKKKLFRLIIYPAYIPLAQRIKMKTMLLNTANVANHLNNSHMHIKFHSFFTLCVCVCIWVFAFKM